MAKFHKLDDESRQNLMDMLVSPDEATQQIGFSVLTNIDTNDKETLNQLEKVSEMNIITLFKKEKSIVKKIMPIFIKFRENEVLKPYENKNQEDWENEEPVLSVKGATELEYFFSIRRKLAENWLDTDVEEIKLDIESQIHEINKITSSILQVDYSTYNDDEE
jgi:hypothetical protein